MDETARRRRIQQAYNKERGIIPKTIVKPVANTLEITRKEDKAKGVKISEIPDEIEKLKAAMARASKQLDFEKAIEIRETIAVLRQRFRKATEGRGKGKNKE